MMVLYSPSLDITYWLFLEQYDAYEAPYAFSSVIISIHCVCGYNFEWTNLLCMIMCIPLSCYYVYIVLHKFSLSFLFVMFIYKPYVFSVCLYLDFPQPPVPSVDHSGIVATIFKTIIFLEVLILFLQYYLALPPVLLLLFLALYEEKQGGFCDWDNC